MAGGWVIHVRGLVQGVGFRPTVWQVANALGLRGSVRNTSAGVTIELACSDAEREQFLEALQAGLPKLARIDGLDVSAHEFHTAPAAFLIAGSELGTVSASVVADAMICEACAGDIRAPENRRFGYAFANCTHCGPRLTIVRKIPYDRANTAMSGFPMCAACRAEYENPADRRFHAEPIACAACGPKLWLETAGGVETADTDPLRAAACLLRSGHIVALKGLGGFHLACRADDDTVVKRLRQAKLRPDKPLALMADTIATVRTIAACSKAEADCLAGRRGPILLLNQTDKSTLAPSVAPGQDRIGIMLPTTPLHALLMDQTGLPLVMTSANESGVPQCIDNDDARQLLGSVADAVLFHDRDIVSRVDDSVVRLDATGLTIIRRARGFAPEPMGLPDCLKSGNSVFAAGADLKSAFAFARTGEVTLSQHLGDLDEPETRQAYVDAIGLYASMFERKPELVAVDLHPGYVSSAFGREYAGETGAKVITVQHHHAHLAACMAENGLNNRPVLGVVLDGTGLGNDGTIWGGEFLVGDYCGFRRAAYFRQVPLIGGDRAATEPWRNGFAHLSAAFGENFLDGEFAELEAFKRLAARPVASIRSVMNSGKLSPLSSSAGRLFDAAAFIIGVAADKTGYEGQTGMELEALARPCMGSARDFSDAAGGPVLFWDNLWRGLLDGLRQRRGTGQLAADFHATLIGSVAAKAIAICGTDGLDTVALTGGVFQNAILLEGIHARLAAAGLNLLVHHQVPANDGGIALGQAAVALAVQTG